MAGYSELFGRLGRNPQSAALLALAGTILMTALLLGRSFPTWSMSCLEWTHQWCSSRHSSYAFGCITVMVFLLVFHRAQR
jgi:hypothetical protein